MKLPIYLKLGNKHIGLCEYSLTALKLFFIFISVFMSFFAQAGLCLRVEGQLISFDEKILRFRTEDGNVDILQNKIHPDMVKSLKKRRYNFNKEIKECFSLDSVVYGKLS